ncbi:MAG: sigma-54-dependent Fis family transcriptional regulator [Armatimonadetes bacterium]|nr:sigma-54-dependent Fis family transcriptional regulator [Armatimonadota bacterium]
MATRTTPKDYALTDSPASVRTPYAFAPSPAKEAETGNASSAPSPDVAPEVFATGPTVLIVDDEPNIRRVLAAVLARDGYKVVIADGGKDAVKKAKNEPVLDVLITDFLMPDMNGLETLEAVRKYHGGVRALFISGHGTVRSAVEAMRLGAFDYITKPFDVEQVRDTVKRALKSAPLHAPAPISAKTSPATTPSPSADIPADIVLPPGVSLIGNAPATQLLKRRLLAAAASRATVLLLGESGTGKEVAARLLHEASPRRRGPFIAVSCAALPETLLESELFGHEKSAFTGAASAKPGRFELADGGTLFLDEIGDIPHITQVKLLRALQEREISRIGGIKTVKVDVRVVGATNRDLWQAVQEGSFRLDLYYRLYVVPVTIPPLRERAEDIPTLAAFFLERSAKENDRAFPAGITPDALARLAAHEWQGNIRELQNALEYAVVMSPTGRDAIEADVLPERLSPAS